MARQPSCPFQRQGQGQTSSLPPQRPPASSWPRPLALGPCLVAIFARGLQTEGVDGRVKPREMTPPSSWELWLCWVT